MLKESGSHHSKSDIAPSDSLKSRIRESAFKMAMMEIGQSLRIRDMVGKALVARGEKDEGLLHMKVALVDAVLEAAEGHLTSDAELSARSFLRSKKCYNDSLGHMDDITSVSPENKVQLRKHLEAHREMVDQKLGKIESSVIKKVAQDLAVNSNGGRHSYASKYFLAYTIIAKKAEGWKWLMVGGAGYVAAGACFWLGAHYDHLNECFTALGGLLFGGGSDRLLKTNKAWQQAKLLTSIFIDKYDRKHLRETVSEIHGRDQL
jgi:hypothetical protein